MTMLAEEYDFVIGGDPDRDTIDLAILDTITGGVHAHLAESADGTGYARILDWARRHAPGRRIWALEGTGSFAAGLSDVLAQAGEDVTELKSLIVAAPEHLRATLRGLSLTKQLSRIEESTTTTTATVEHRVTVLTMQSITARIRFLTGQLDELDPELGRLLRQHPAGPGLLAQPGVGPVVAARLLLSWSHPGRVRNEAAFASLAGVAPLEASNGQRSRHRRSRGGDRALDRIHESHGVVATTPILSPGPKNTHMRFNDQLESSEQNSRGLPSR